MIELLAEGDASGGAEAVMHVGVVYGVRDVRLVMVAESRPVLLRRLAGYVEREAEYQLTGESARLLRNLLENDDTEHAVRFYFDRVGERWDREWLYEAAVPVAWTLED